MFAEGSSVHLYRVFFYSGSSALSPPADLASDAWAAAHALAYSRARRTPDWIPAAGARSHHLLRGHRAARLAQPGRAARARRPEPHYSPEQQKLRFAAHEGRARHHPLPAPQRKEFWYYIDRNYNEIQSLAQLDKLKETLGKSVLILDERLLSVANRPIYERLMAAAPGHLLETHGDNCARRRRGRMSSPSSRCGCRSLYRWFISHKYPPLVLVRRAYLPGDAARSRSVPVAANEVLNEPTDARLLPLLPRPARQSRSDGAGAGRRHRDGQAADDPESPTRRGAHRRRRRPRGQARGSVRRRRPRDRRAAAVAPRNGKVTALLSPSLALSAGAHWKAPTYT